MVKVWTYVLFFLSGVSALIYELVWQRQLSLVFGVSTLSVSTVLAAFMGGLALGGLFFGRLADRARRPLLLYGLLEGGIGVVGLLLPLSISLLTAVYCALYEHLQPGQWGGALLRFAIAFPLLAGLSALIGGTLPLMGRLGLDRTTALPTTYSLIYALNTFGAVVGAALTGFVLLRFLGMRETLWLAAGLNFLIAASAIAMSFMPGRRLAVAASEHWSAPPALASPSPSRYSPWFALGCAAITGASAMGFEVAWARVLGILTSNSAFGFALILSVLLLGLSIGGLFQWWWSRRPGDYWMRLVLCQTLLAAFTLASLPYFHTTPEWLERLCDGQSVSMVFVGEFGLTALALLVPGILMGMSLPLLLACVTTDPGRFGNWLGRLQAVNTLGCVVGAFVTGFIAIPLMGIHATFGILAGATLLVGFASWWMAARPALAWRRLTGVAALAAATVGWLMLPVGGYFKSAVREPRRLLYYHDGNNGTVTVVQEANGARSIMVDGQPVAGTARTSIIDQKMLAHLPLLLHPDPHRALTVGFGSGGTSMSMTLHDVDVDCVEIEAAVPAAAEHFHSENRGILSSPRFHLIVDDARSWLRVAPVAYDVIVTDCTNIQYRSNGDLYTVDFFRLIQERLAPAGLAAAWVPANGIREEDLKTLVRSFREAFPHTSIWYMNTAPTDFLIVVGTPAPLAIDMARLAERMHTAGVREDLAAVGVTDSCRLVYSLLVAEEGLAAYLGDGPCNTDDRPVLSYSTYGATFQPTIAENLLGLMTCREDAAKYVSHPEPCKKMLQHYAASNEMLLGHIGYFTGVDSAALSHYLKGSGLLPEDPSCFDLVRAAYFRLRKAEENGSASPAPNPLPSAGN
jgi:spermidine synthase